MQLPPPRNPFLFPATGISLGDPPCLSFHDVRVYYIDEYNRREEIPVVDISWIYVDQGQIDFKCMCRCKKVVRIDCNCSSGESWQRCVDFLEFRQLVFCVKKSHTQSKSIKS